MPRSTASRAIKSALYVLLMAVFGLASFANAAATYRQFADNENNAHTGTSDDDVYRYLGPGAANAPVEFNIDVTGDVPRYSAVLVVYGFDIDAGEVAQLSFNGVALGALDVSPQSDWSLTTVELPLALVRQGDNLVEIAIEAHDRIKIGGAELKIDVDAPDDGVAAERARVANEGWGRASRQLSCTYHDN